MYIQTGFGSIFDDASSAISRGITGALPEFERTANSLITNVVNTNLPVIQTRVSAAIRDGLEQGATIAQRRLAESTSSLMPALKSSLESGATDLVDKYKPVIIGVGVAAGLLTLTGVVLQALTVYHLRKR
jgi:hypothetical protein